VRNLLFMVWVCLLLPAQAMAQDAKPKFEGLLNKLLAPGPLMIGHADLEHKDCLACHEPAGGVPNKMCVDCHKEIRAHLDAKAHYHGLMKGKACIDCHKDHKGRAFDATAFNKDKFDHNRTGFALDGAHAKTECIDCHTEKRSKKPIRQNETRYFGTVNSCNLCHKADDIHYFKGEFKAKECSLCHTTEKWKPAKAFDHLKETGYALIGAHAKHKCDKCHVKTGKTEVRYDWPIKNRQCLSCHKDHHGTNLSPRFRNGKCNVCHSQDTWKMKL